MDRPDRSLCRPSRTAKSGSSLIQRMRCKRANTRRGAADICVVAAILCAFALAGPPEPETCALCGNGEGRPYHAPCVVERSTGLVAELAIYDPEPTQMGALAPVQDLDRHFFQAACGGRVVRTVDRSPEEQSCTAYVPVTEAGVSKRLFCRACRKRLAGAGQGEYVLADLYDPEHIAVWPVEAGRTFQVRGYTVAVSEEDAQYQIEVTAKLF